MGQNPIVAGNVLAAGLRAEFADSYRRTYEGVAERLGQVMELGIPSDKITETYGYFESSPYPRRWDRGDTISSKNFLSRQFSVSNLDWGRRVEWHVNDRMDDQTQTLMDQARAAGQNWATLNERIFFQMIQGSVNAELLSAVPLAPDGLALYAAARFGTVDGNLLAGSGVATASAVRDDFYAAVEQFVSFQDTEDEPLWLPEIIDQGFIVIFGVANLQLFQEAFRQNIVENVAGTAAPSNIIKDAGLNVTLWPTQRIADDDYYIFLRGAHKRALFEQTRQPLQEHVATMDTSDSARDTKIEYVQWDSRSGYGVALPFATVKIDN